MQVQHLSHPTMQCKLAGSMRRAINDRCKRGSQYGIHPVRNKAGAVVLVTRWDGMHLTFWDNGKDVTHTVRTSLRLGQRSD